MHILVSRLATAGVDSIGALGSTGGYAYLTRDQRARAPTIAVEAADGVPVIDGLNAGSDAWYSVNGGLLPQTAPCHHPRCAGR